MLYGICSDIHANATAFEAVLTSMKENGVERRVCLGDLVGYGKVTFFIETSSFF